MNGVLTPLKILGELSGRLAHSVLPMFEVSANGLESMEPVDRQQRQNAEVGDQYRPIEPGKLMDACKRVVEEPACNPVQRGRDQQRGQERRQVRQRMHPGVRFSQHRAESAGTENLSVSSTVYTGVNDFSGF